MGKRYGMLPSRVLKEADSFDVYIMDAAISYERYLHDKEMSKHNGLHAGVNLTQDQLLEGLKKFKEGK